MLAMVAAEIAYLAEWEHVMESDRVQIRDGGEFSTTDAQDAAIAKLEKAWTAARLASREAAEKLGFASPERLEELAGDAPVAS